jgi:predicted nucleotidyltransferase
MFKVYVWCPFFLPHPRTSTQPVIIDSTNALDTFDPMTQEVQTSIDSAVKALVSALNPKQIYLFGSCAKGTAVAYSDIDLLVVVEDGVGEKLSNMSRAYRATRGLPIAKDIIVDHESVFNRRSQWSSSIEREVITSGKLIYGRS